MSLRAIFANAARPRCYVASPLGFSETGRDYYASRFLPALAEHVEPVDPWALTGAAEFEAAAAQDRTRAFGIEVGARNADAIRSAQLLVAQLDGQEIDAGTAAEVGYAAALGIACLAVRSDLRCSGEPGMRVNLQLEAFIEQSGGFIAGSLDELVARLAELRAAGAPDGDGAEAATRALAVAAAQVRLASAYQRDEHTEEAVTLDGQIAAALHELLGPDHRTTRLADEVLAASHRLLRSCADRAGLARAVLELRERLVAELAARSWGASV